MKKLLCLFLCLLLIVPAAVSLADNTITSIILTITPPKAGSTTSTNPVVTVPSDCHYKIYGTYWITDDFEDVLPGNIVLEGGKTYHIGVSLTADSGYEFAPVKAYITNGVYNAAFTPIVYNGGRDLDMVVDVTVPKPIVDQVTVSGGVYKLDHSKLTATLISAADKNAKKLTIPNTVSANDKTYKVTEIKSKACSGMKKLTTVTIGANVKKIGAQAFAKCKKLSKITIKNAKMAKSGFGSKCFNGIKSKATFKVPKKMLEKYKEWIIKNGKAPKNSKITK
ncbi:MAG: leucine-rich repeat protein [Clostridia bacterium]|nr:leucine-rich repeat protein [Clostridia bacterium]